MSGSVRLSQQQHGQSLAVNKDEGHGDGCCQGSRGVGLLDSGAAVPHLPLWGRDLLPGHSGQHRATCRGGALHQGPTAEVNFSKRGSFYTCIGTMEAGEEVFSMGEVSGMRGGTPTLEAFFMERLYKKDPP